MKMKTSIYAVLAAAMVITQACAADASKDGDYGYGYGYGYGGMHGGSHHGMGMEGRDGDYGGHGHHRGHGGGMHGSGTNLMAMAKFKGIYRLNLSDDQRKKFKAIKHKLKKDLWQLMGKMIDVKDGLRDLWEVDKPDPSKVGAAYKDMFDLERQAIELRVTARNQIYDMLTKEQRERFRDGYHGHYGGHHGGGHHGMHHDDADGGQKHGHGPM